MCSEKIISVGNYRYAVNSIVDETFRVTPCFVSELKIW